MKSHSSQPDAAVYCIRLKGHVPPAWAEWFSGMRIDLAESGDTLLTGALADQAALHGVLRAIRDLGLPLLSLAQIDAAPVDAPVSDQQTGEHP